MEQRINALTLGVADLAAARAFYEDGLGWRASSASNHDIVFFDLKGVVFALYERHALAADTGLRDGEWGTFGGIVLTYRVRDPGDTAKLLVRAARAGGKILRPAQDVYWGGHVGYFSDLDHHVWEVGHNPQFSLDANGHTILGDRT